MKKILFLAVFITGFAFSQEEKIHVNEYTSQLNIPFVHFDYNQFEFLMNQQENSHTASKPYIYQDVQFLELQAKNEALFKDKSSFFGKKLWNEHFVTVTGKDFWFSVDPMVDLQLGKDNSDESYTYNNTRALRIQGGLGKNLSFSTSFYESQGRFADYINQEARSLNTLGAGATMLGRGKAKGFKTNGFDYPVAEAYLSYTPSELFNFQFGNGKNFIGDGYRSFMVSDVASPYPYLKISTKFWKVKYTNLWMWMDDVRRDFTTNEENLRKYVSVHHLSWNVTKKFNLGLFEAVITNNENNRGYDINFFNPVIFYRAVEFTRGSESGNAIIGLNSKYKLTDKATLYGQFLLDELTVGRFFDGSGYWANKYAIQFGGKYSNAFNIENLFLQGEFNYARPYIFSHFKSTLNYGHFNQPIGHLWGSNFWEAIAIANYRKDRWFANAKLVFGEKGFDFQGSDVSYGGNIYISNENRSANEGINTGQGNKTNVLIGDIQAGYLVNPSTNLKVFAGFTLRNFDMQTPYKRNPVKENTTWFTFGIKTDVFNWYFDF